MPNSLPSRPPAPSSARPHARTYVRPHAPQPKPVRIRRRLATIAGLGLAGLVAGLLSGCSLTVTGSSLTATLHALSAGTLIHQSTHGLT